MSKKDLSILTNLEALVYEEGTDIYELIKNDKLEIGQITQLIKEVDKYRLVLEDVVKQPRDGINIYFKNKIKKHDYRLSENEISALTQIGTILGYEKKTNNNIITYSENKYSFSKDPNVFIATLEGHSKILRELINKQTYKQTT